MRVSPGLAEHGLSVMDQCGKHPYSTLMAATAYLPELLWRYAGASSRSGLCGRQCVNMDLEKKSWPSLKTALVFSNAAMHNSYDICRNKKARALSDCQPIGAVWT